MTKKNKTPPKAVPLEAAKNSKKSKKPPPLKMPTLDELLKITFPDGAG